MRPTPDLSPIGALVGEKTRATMLAELLDGRALTATELATRAGVSPATASVHLSKLVEGGLLALDKQGRHRYFRLARREVARALETLAGLDPRPPARRPVPHDLRFARTCYDHLAGWLGVAVKEALVTRAFLEGRGAELDATPRGETWLRSFGVDVAAARAARRSFARLCLDWTERRPHLAGALGEALLARLLERRWLERRPAERMLDLTPAGRRGLAKELGLSIIDA
jgi:DNA-binding transcriptional ArsR family regulator